MSNKKERPVKAEVKAGYSRPLVAGVLVTALSSLAGCSSVPDAVNPAEWYKSTVDFFAGEDGEGQVSQEKQAGSDEETPIPGEDKAFPELSSVPARPTAPVQGGLVADTDKRKYAQPIARQGEATEMLAAQPPAAPPAPSSEQVSTTMVSPVQPAPPAMPAAPVVQAPASMPAAPSAPAPSDANFASIVPNTITLTPPPSAPAMPANAMASINEDPYGTVVVSSMGIEMAAAGAATAPAAVAQSAPMVDAQPMTTTLRQATQATVGGVKVATILFETGSSGLSQNDRRILGEVVRLHQQRGGTVTVVGHASSRTRNMDPVRHKMVNYSVSVDRADRIATELRSMGMAPDMIVVDARADNMPLYYESMPSGEAGNRRAEIYFQN
ncbi:MAG: OmpA family protein [Rhodospirillaceae bacterium]|nr:OmpA family protein [Rhodospirillaceae bacterium]